MINTKAQSSFEQETEGAPNAPPSKGQLFFGGKSERRWLGAITLAYAVLCLFYNIITPIGEACDELDHIRYVEHLVRFGSFAPISAGTQMPYTLEAKQPPAYYFLNAGLMLGFGRCGQQLAPELERNPNGPSMGPDAPEVYWFIHPPVPNDLLPWTHLMRLVGLLLGVGTILLTFATVREVLPSRDHVPLALCAAALVGLLPTFTFVTATVNNDNLAILVGAAICYRLMRILARGTTLRDAVILGALLGLALLSKMNTLGFIPVVFFVLFVNKVKLRDGGDAVARQPSSLSAQILRGLSTRVLVVSLALAACLVIAGWWYARNVLLYGDVFASGAVTEMANAVIDWHRSTFDPLAPGAWLVQLFMVLGTHYGAFGCVTVKAPLILWLLYLTMLLLAFIGLIVLLARRQINITQVSQVAVAVLTVMLVYATMVYNAVGQGRLLYPTIAFTSLLTALGTYGLFSLVGRKMPPRTNAIATAVLWGAFLGVTNVFCLFWVLIPAWY